MNALPTRAAIGRRIELARSAHGLTQAELATALGISSHQSISELEKGERRLQPVELVRLSKVLDRPIDYFTDPFLLVGEAKYSWRRSADLPDDACAPLEAQVDRLVALMRWLRYQTEEREALKFALRLSDQSSFEDAQAAGEQLAKQLKLGPVPAERLVEKIEVDLDVPVLYIDFPVEHRGDHVSGLAVHLADFTCILINRRESPGRRAFDLAHELFHALTWEALPPPTTESNRPTRRGTGRRHRVEQLADNFAAALLMPLESLEASLANIDISSPDDLRALADHFGVTTDALGYRLLNLKRITPDVRQKLAMLASGLRRQTPMLFSAAFVSLLATALLKGSLSPRLAAKVMGISLDDLDAVLRERGYAHAIEF